MQIHNYNKNNNKYVLFTQGSFISIHTVLPEGPAIILLTRSSDSGLTAHNVCTFSTPWGAFQPGVIFTNYI